MPKCAYLSRPVVRAGARFDADEASERLQFDYLLRPGVSSQRLGLRVLKQEGVFDLLDRAVAALAAEPQS